VGDLGNRIATISSAADLATEVDQAMRADQVSHRRALLRH
jgi:hypothetical protein